MKIYFVAFLVTIFSTQIFADKEDKKDSEADIDLDSNNKKPSYLALKQDECHATVKVTEKTGFEIVNTESFDVNVCKKEIYKVIN